MSKSQELGTALVQTLRAEQLPGVVGEYAEIGIDAVLSEGLLRDIPFVSTLIALAKFGLNVSDRLLINKLIKFLGPLHHLSPEMRQEMVQKLEADPAYGRKVGEHLIELLDRVEAHLKPEMLAAVFAAYTKGEIDARMLHRLNVAIDRLPLFELPEVRKFHTLPPTEHGEMDPGTLHALSVAGLAIAASGWSALVYEPSEVCEVFLRLNLDGSGRARDHDVTDTKAM